MEKNALAIDLNFTYSAKQESQEAQLGYHHRMYSDLILNSISKVKKMLYGYYEQVFFLRYN